MTQSGQDHSFLVLFSLGITKGKWSTLVTELINFKDLYDANAPLKRVLFRSACSLALPALGNLFEVALLRAGGSEKHPPSSALRFNFKGKSGKVWKLNVRDRRIAKVIRACQELPGQELFQYLDDGGETRDVTSSDVNAYLREISGDDITAKDFRTWHGTVLAALALQEFEKLDSQAGAKRNIRDAIQKVAARLGNTPTICRKCYIHPEIITTYIEWAAGPGPVAGPPVSCSGVWSAERS